MNLESSTIPKKIWILWHQGLDQAPALVKECHKAWVALNPEWEVVVLDSNNLGEYIDVEKYITNKIPMQAFSDIVRILLLEKYGGVWVDATTLPTQPLNSWLSQAASKGFFAFSKPGYDRTISSWFLATEKENPIILSWSRKVLSFWKTGRLAPKFIQNIFKKKTTILLRLGLAFSFKKPMKLIKKIFGVFPYYWFHYLFEDALEENKDAKKVWQETKKISAKNSHRLTNYGLKKKPSQEIKDFISRNTTPVYKLSWRINLKEESTADYLIKENRKKYEY